ncbi:MAG: hypothetical protein M5R36_02945 [Deltaproteobacteria bacterium]|nr:hypothetical protein [Deltaproteobacteria bacterium]
MMGDYMIDMIVDHPALGEVNAMTAALSLRLPVGISVTPQGKILLEIDPGGLYARYRHRRRLRVRFQRLPPRGIRPEHRVADRPAARQPAGRD